MRAAMRRGHAEWEAESLSEEQCDYLTGATMRRRVVPALAARGLTDDIGRVTAFGAEVARALIDDEAAASVWTDADSAQLSARLVALDGHAMRLKGEALAAAIVTMSRRGLSTAAASKRLGITTDRCAQIAREQGAPFVREDRRVNGGIPNMELYRRASAAGRRLAVVW